MKDTRPRLQFPYLPPVSAKSHRKHPYQHHIAYTLHMRGDDDNLTPFIVLYGAPFELVRDVCVQLCRHLSGYVSDMVITPEHSCRIRNGRCYWRMAVEVQGLNASLMPAEGVLTLFTSYMRRLCNCTLRRYRLHDFINL